MASTEPWLAAQCCATSSTTGSARPTSGSKASSGPAAWSTGHPAPTIPTSPPLRQRRPPHRPAGMSDQKKRYTCPAPNASRRPRPAHRQRRRRRWSPRCPPCCRRQPRARRQAGPPRPAPPDHRMGPMAKKAAPKKPPGKKSKSPSPHAGEGRGGGFVERIAEEVESRFFEGAEMATETTSAETNAALAALAAIEGPPDSDKAEAKPAHGKRKPARSKKR